MSNADLDASRTAKGKLSIFDILLIERERTFWWVCEDSDGEEQMFEEIWIFSQQEGGIKSTWSTCYLSPHITPPQSSRFLLLAGKYIFSRCCWNKKVQMNPQILFLVKEFPMLWSWLFSQNIWEASSDELKASDLMYDILYTLCQLSKKLSQT